MGSVDHPLAGNNHDIIGVAHTHDAHDFTIALACADISHALAASALLAITHTRSSRWNFTIFICDNFLLFHWFFSNIIGQLIGIAHRIRAKRSAFTIAFFAKSKEETFGICNNHAYNSIVCADSNTPNTLGITTRITGIGLIKANSHAVTGNKNNFIGVTNKSNLYKGVALFEVDTDDATLAGMGIQAKRGLLDQTISGCHDQAKLFRSIKRFHRNNTTDLFLGLKGKNISHRTTLGSTVRLRQLINHQPVKLTKTSKAKQMILRICDEELIDKIIILGRATTNATATTMLGAVSRNWQPFNIALMAKSNSTSLVNNKIEVIHIANFASDFGSAWVRILGFKLGELFANFKADVLFIGNQDLVSDDLATKIIVLAQNFIAFKSSKLTQLHTHHSLGLRFGHAVFSKCAQLFLQISKVGTTQRPRKH